MDVRVRHHVDPGIRYSLDFLGWQAAIAAGASLDELVRWERGEYTHQFMGRVIAWYELHNAVIAHQEDAAQSEK